MEERSDNMEESGPKNGRRLRRSYDVNFKMMAIIEAESTNNLQAAEKFGVTECNVRRWRAQKDHLQHADSQRKAFRGPRSGRFQELERRVSEYVDEQLKVGLEISRAAIRRKAAEMAEELNIRDFKASLGWCKRMLRRHGVTLRYRRCSAQRRPCLTDFGEKRLSFRRRVVDLRKKHSYPLDQIGKADQTAVVFDAVCKNGEESSGSEESSATVMLACLADGTKLPPYVVLKRKTLPEEATPAGVIVRAREDGCMEAELVVDWLKAVWAKRRRGKKRNMLILDVFGGRSFDPVEKRVKAMNGDLVITSRLPGFDVAVEPFKENLRRKHSEWLGSLSPTGNVQTPSVRLLCEWILQAWDAVSPESIVHGFEMCFISNALDGGEDGGEDGERWAEPVEPEDDDAEFSEAEDDGSEDSDAELSEEEDDRSQLLSRSTSAVQSDGVSGPDWQADQDQRGGGAMSASWRDDDEEFKAAGVKGALKAKPRFSFTEVKLLLEAVKRNRYIILRKFNQGVSAETKKQTWAEITNQINGLGENHREVRQIMKKWADLKCDGKRRIVALRGPNGSHLRKKNLGPVEKMVHKILMMSPRGDGDSDMDLEEDGDFSSLCSKGSASNPSAYSYLSLTDGHSLPGGASYDLSPLSSPEKDLGGDPLHSSSDFDQADDGERAMDFDETDDAGDDARTRVKPVHTYSRSTGSQNHTSSRPPPVEEDAEASASSVPPPPPPPLSPSSALPPPPPASSTAATDSTSLPAPPSSSIPPPPSSSSSSSSAASTTTSTPSSSVTPHRPSPSPSALPPGQPSTSAPNPSDPLPAGASSRRALDHVAQMASQSLQQQRASRMLLTSVSQSLEALAQSVQLLVESQQEFVQESLLLQRETVDILRDFSNTALTMLRDKANGGQLPAHHHQHHQHHHPASHF